MSHGKNKRKAAMRRKQVRRSVRKLMRFALDQVNQVSIANRMFPSIFTDPLFVKLGEIRHPVFDFPPPLLKPKP